VRSGPVETGPVRGWRHRAALRRRFRGSGGALLSCGLRQPPARIDSSSVPHPADPSISSDEKRAAVQRVLDSRALGRSEQLRKLLSYVCDAAIEGRSGELNEYVLGVAVLGRPEGYSPAEDSCVRSRAYELRSRLRAYYEAEAPDDPLRIEIDKGGYSPRFQRVDRAAARGRAAGRAEAELPTRELEALWGPLLEGSAPLLIAFDVRLFFYVPALGLVVRDFRVNDPARLAESEPLREFQQRTGAEELRETRDYADFGTVHAAFLLGRLLAGSRRDIVLKHTSSLDWQDVRNSHLVFIGKPNLNPVIASLLAGREFRIDDLGVIHNERALPGEAARYESAPTHGAGEKHALITRLRGPQPGRYVLLLSSGAAELMWALAESVTNPGHVAELLAHLRTPAGEYAEQFQVVIRATFQDNVPVDIRYVTHRVLG